MAEYVSLTKSQIMELHNKKRLAYEQFGETQAILNDLIDKTSDVAILVTIALEKSAEHLSKGIHKFIEETYKQYKLKYCWKIDVLFEIAKGIKKGEIVTIKRDYD